MIVQYFGRCPPSERLARTAVEGSGNRSEIIGGVRAQVRAFREVLAQQTIGVLIRAPLPWTLRVAEEDLQSGVETQLRVLGHLGALVPRQRTTQLLRQGDDAGGNRLPHCVGAMTS